MRTPFAIAALLCFGMTASCVEARGEPPSDVPAAVDTSRDEDWVLVFDDEFDRPGVDPTKWFVRTRHVRQKKTLNSTSPEMATLDNGALHLRAGPTPEDESFPYTAGYVDTDGLFAQTYGKLELRMRGDFAPGLWYAVWGRPWANPVPELDIELLADNVTQVWLVNHWDLPPLPADDRRSFLTVNGTDIREPHVYAVIWTPDYVEWQMDGKTLMHVTGRGVPHEPIFWVINAWVGGWAGAPTSATTFPAGFEVDYFRVYRPRAWTVPPSIRVRNPRATYDLGDTIRIEIADFDANAHVEVLDGAEVVATIDRPPFWYTPRHLGRGAHSLTFVAKDGARQATTSLDVEIE